MTNNKSIDGIKKLSEQDLKKARDVVLQSIGEKSKHAKPVSGISNEEADKIEVATEKFKPKQVDGLVGRQQTADPPSLKLRRASDRPADAKVAAGRQQTVESGSVLASAEVDQKKSEKENAEQLKLNRQRIKEKEAEDEKQRLEQIEQERLNQEKIKERQRLEKVKQLKHKNPPSSRNPAGLRRASAKTLKHLPRQQVKAGKNAKTRKREKLKKQEQTKFLLSERRTDAQSKLLITSYLLLVLTLIIIVGSVGFFTIWYNLNDYAVLTKANKVKQMMESGANFYQIAKSQGDEFGVGKYYTYNEAAVKFGQNIVNLEIGRISMIKHADSGYYLIQCYGSTEKLIGLKYIFIKSRSLDDYVSEMMSGLWIWNLAD